MNQKHELPSRVQRRGSAELTKVLEFIATAAEVLLEIDADQDESEQSTMAIDRKLLGKSIRQVRELRGLSQAALAKESGMQGNSVALIERGERGVSMEKLNALADALEIPAACLAMLGTSKVANGAESNALVQSMQELIVATVVAQARIQAKEEAEEAKQQQIEEAMHSIPDIDSLMQRRATKRRRATRTKSKASKKSPARKTASKRPEHA